MCGDCPEDQGARHTSTFPQEVLHYTPESARNNSLQPPTLYQDHCGSCRGEGTYALTVED